MSNMSYCIFKNTLEDYIQAYNHLSDVGINGLSESERKEAIKLINLSKKLVDEFYEN